MVSTDPAASPDIPAVRELLRARLPEYMLPATFITLDSMPLTRNGKIDTRALPPPTEPAPTSPVPTPPPEPGPARHRAEPGPRSLGIRDQIGAHDNFLELGGHSLLAIQVVSPVAAQTLVLASRYGRCSPPRQSAALAEFLASADADNDRVPAIKTAQRTSPLPPSFAQQRLWFLDQLEPRQ